MFNQYAFSSRNCYRKGSFPRLNRDRDLGKFCAFRLAADTGFPYERQG
jgi:hypothetical protein